MVKEPWKLLLLLFLILYLTNLIAGDADTHTYDIGEEVPLYVNVIGPYANPSEIYEYYTLPFCLPPDATHRHLGLGEVIEGNRDVRINSLYDLRFRVEVEWNRLCKMDLDVADVEEFQRAIEEDYYFQMTVDDLPVWGFVGTQELVDSDPETEEETARLFLYTHLSFTIGYNGNQVVDVNVVAQRTELIPNEPNTFEFSYSAHWVETAVPFEKRMERYTQNTFFPKDMEIHWLSILNSAILAVLLSAFLAAIVMRILRADYARYSKLDDPEADAADAESETGWKVVAGDVFRSPPMSALLAAALGNGAQVMAIVTGTLILGAAGVIYPYSRGTMYTAAVALYAFTSVINGYVSASMYKTLGGEKWVWNIMLAAILLVGPIFIMWAVLNSVAWAYASAQALPAGTVILLMLIWLCVGFPLTVLGGIAGRNWTGALEAPCRTHHRPRDLPAVPWYRAPLSQVAMAGLLPFSAIYIELDYIFNSVWGHRPYTLYGMLLLAFCILLVVTACISVAMTYFQLSAEDYRWWWRALFSGGSTASFIFGYAVFFFLYRSEMNGFMQAAFFFGYVALVCYMFFLLLGMVGFLSSFVFVQRIYRAIKSD